MDSLSYIRFSPKEDVLNSSRFKKKLKEGKRGMIKGKAAGAGTPIRSKVFSLNSAGITSRKITLEEEQDFETKEANIRNLNSRNRYLRLRRSEYKRVFGSNWEANMDYLYLNGLNTYRTVRAKIDAFYPAPPR